MKARTLFLRLLSDGPVRSACPPTCERRHALHFTRVTYATVPCKRVYAGFKGTLWVLLPGKAKSIMLATMQETKGWRPAHLRDKPRPTRWYLTPKGAKLLRIATDKPFTAWEVA